VISPGTYDISISDPTYVGDVLWDLAGPGVKLVTNMSSGEETSETWVEAFLPSSTYTYRDDLRPPAVWTFVTSSTSTVTSGGGPVPPTSSAGSGTTGKATSTDVVGSAVKSTPFRGTLAVTVSTKGLLKLTLKGKAVATLESGRYTFAVVDSSKTGGFTVQQYHKAARTVTSGPFVGRKSVTIDLAPGQWLCYTSFVGRKTYFVVT
jgi:hypothetical protein